MGIVDGKLLTIEGNSLELFQLVTTPIAFFYNLKDC